MLIGYIGGVGSGKSLSMTREILKKVSEGQTIYCNYPIISKNVHRLKWTDVLCEKTIVKNGKEKTGLGVNWDFWEDKTGFSIVLDEIHNVLHARKPSSNVNMINWIAQLRKILGEDEDYNFMYSSQIMERVDIALRDLTTEIIYCETYYKMRVGGGYKMVLKNQYKRVYSKQGYKVKSIPTVVQQNKKYVKKLIPLTIIRQYHFIGTRCLEKLHTWEFTGEKTYDSENAFIGNPYMRYYESFKKVRFGEDVYLS